jgi:AraC-like DNA-binding protein
MHVPGNYPKLWNMMLDAAGVIPVVVKSVERIHDSSWSMDISTHDHFEIVYMRKGRAIFEIAGKKVSLEPNEVILIQPNQQHSFSVPDNIRCEFIVLRFMFVESSKHNAVTVSPDEFMVSLSDNAEKAFVKCKVGRNSELANVINRICINNAKKSELDYAILNWLLFMEMFVYISRAIKEGSGKKSRHMCTTELAHEAREFIIDNYMKDISLADISNYVFLSQSYFSRVFKEEYNVSPIQFLLRLRIKEAKNLLANSNMKMGDIALKVGFSTQQRFNEVFKKYVSMSPHEYRKRSKANRLNM